MIRFALILGLTAISCSVLWGADANIAPIATIETTPAMAPAARHLLVDGLSSTVAVFDVHTQGPGIITFTFPSPHEISAVRIYLSSDVYRADAMRVEADTAGTGRFDHVLGQWAALRTGEWNELKFAPITVHAVRFVTTAGAAKGLRAYPAVGEIEIRGTMTAEDQQRLLQSGGILPRLASDACIRVARSPRTGTSLSGTVHIAVPADPAWQTAGAELAQGLEKAGVVKAEVLAGDADPFAKPGALIALGHAGNNPLIARLYWSRYTFADALFPGPDGYLLQTVGEPVGAMPGQDVIVIGGDTVAAVQPAVKALLKAVQAGGGSLPFQFTVHAPAYRAPAVPTAPPKFSLVGFTKAVEDWLHTGNNAFLKHAVAVLRTVADGYDKQPERPLPWSEETSSWKILAAWDVVEDLPVFTSAERLRFTNLFLRVLEQLRGRCAGYSGIDSSATVAWNHTTFALLGIYYGARNMVRYYPMAQLQVDLQKAHDCFTGQLRSWKPQEDADGYFVLTESHAIQYALATWNLRFFQDGLARQFADYVISVCDSRGWASGFGDSGYGYGSSLIQNYLLPVVWWTRDPGYVWVIKHVTNGQWVNPFDPDLKPVEPDRFTGLRVFAMDPQLYDYTCKHPYYNEPLMPVTVPAAEAFDKVAFRQSWDPDSQYMLLDGFARGKHMHFDGNAIIELVQDGERWLIDHDYLIRNTTEHNMLSVIHDGRSEALEPPLAGLRAAVDLPGAAMTESYVPDYNGVNWTRRIFWRKGTDFFVVDSMQAAEPGEYQLDLVWKGVDRGSDGPAPDGRSFTMRETHAAASNEATVIDDPDASGGKAVLLGSPTARLSFGIDLPKGNIPLRVTAYGLDGSSDSLWISIDGGSPIDFNIAQLKYGSSSASWDHSTPTPSLPVLTTGRHTIVVTLRENPPVRIDRFDFLVNGKVVTLEAEKASAQPLPKQAPPVTKQFSIVSAVPTGTRIVRHSPEGISVPVIKYYQRLSANLTKGEQRTFANWLHGGTRVDRATMTGTNIAGVGGPQPMVVAWDDWKSAGLQGQGAGAILQPDRLDLFQVTRFSGAGIKITNAAPIDGELKLADGTGELRAASAAAFHGLRIDIQDKPADITGQGKTRTIRFAKIRVPLLSLPTEAEAAPAPAASVPAAQPAWIGSLTEAGADAGEITRVRVAPLQPGGPDCIFVTHGITLTVLSADGKQLWTFQTQGIVRDVAVGDLDPSPGNEVVIGSTDSYVYELSADGKLLHKERQIGPPWNENIGDRPQGVYCVAIGDINGDGRKKIVVVRANYEVLAYDAQWKQLWLMRETALHGAMDLVIRAMKRGETPRIVLGDKYGSVHVLTGDGKSETRSYSSIGDIEFATPDLNGDGDREIVYGSSTGDLLAINRKADVLWRFDNFGYAAQRILTWPIGGKDCVALVSETGYVYLLDGQGKEQWRYACPAVPTDAVVAGDSLFVTCEDGSVVQLDAAGKLRRRWALGNRAAGCAVLPAGGVADVVVVTAAGKVARLAPAR